VSMDDEFRATEFFSRFTDHLPFTFWVKPCIMQPAFSLVADGTGAPTEAAATAAVLSGHFMVWAGPATTCYQRLFVPDWVTCALIQPLGLMEDVAVVLSTWAGESPASQRAAEISLYAFMFLMNLVHAATVKVLSRKDKVQHVIVGCLVVAALSIRCFFDNPFITVPSVITAATTAAPTPAMGAGSCASEHANTKAMLETAGWVSFLACLFNVAASALTYPRFCEAGEEGTRYVRPESLLVRAHGADEVSNAAQSL
jgi:hypothetical protein